ncbi:MAG: EAL domain-containing protein [Gammaproteobacteria bacterium]|nr:EAL domain-containing protein [Gammaproteobacteria bacterium]
MSDKSDTSDGVGLVISTHKDTWRIARRALRSASLKPVHIPGIEDAHDIVQDLRPAVLILDGSDIDVAMSCRALRAVSGCEYIPLLLLADDRDVPNPDNIHAVDVTAVLTKPVSADRLADYIESVGDTGKTLSGMRALRPSDAQLLDGVPDAFFVVSKTGEFRQYLGGAIKDPVLVPDELEGRKVTDVWPADTCQQFLDGIRRAIKTRAGHTLRLEVENDGRRSEYEVRLLVQGRDRVMTIFRDISSGGLQDARENSNRSSDELTGLVASDVFMSQFETIVADARIKERGLAVMCIEIDGFERINETLGRAVGDAVLKVAAQRVQRCLRDYDQIARLQNDSDTNLARLGSDEFVLLLGEIESRENIATVANRVRAAFVEPVSINERKLQIAPSIGIAQFPLDGKDSESLLRNARVALDEAKIASADGHEFYSNTMRFRALNRFDVKDELRWAIDNEQLEIHYLPRIDLQTGHVAGLEALLRWIHPLRGSVPLHEVIPLAEATGLIFAIGEWVIRSTCRQAQAWNLEYGEVPPVSVNLSQQEFARDDLPLLVGNALKDTGLPPEKLELELTEAMLMRSRQANAQIAALHELGVGIVLDDFGQGHSSVARLTELPIKAIKIDRAFTENILEPGKQQAICAAMIAMSRELGFSVVAEGVESELQVQFLKERGCDAVQGFLFTEPLPPDQVPGFLTACVEVAEETQVVDLTTVRQKIASRAFS